MVNLDDSELRHWPIVVAGFVVMSMTQGAASSIGVFYVEWYAEFPESAALIGWLSTSLLTMLLFTAAFAGALTQYFGVRPVVMAGVALSFSGLLIASFATHVYHLVITLPFLTGIGLGMSYTGVLMITSIYFHEHFALALGIAATGAGVGLLVMPVFLAFLIERYGWRGALIVFSAVEAHVGVCGAIMRTPRKQMSQDAKRQAGNYGSMDEHRGMQEGLSYRRLVEDQDGDTENASSERNDNEVTSDPRREVKSASSTQAKVTSAVMNLLDHTGISLFWTNRVFVSCLLMSATDAPICGITLPYLTARALSVGVPALQAASLLSIIGVSNIIGCLTAGQLVDARVAGPPCFFGCAVALASVASMLIAVTTSYPIYVGCAAVIGLATGVYIPMTPVIVRRIVGPERYPGGVGVILVIVAIGGMVSSTIGGSLHEISQRYSTTFVFEAVVAGLCAAITLALHLLWTRLVPDDRWPTNHAVQPSSAEASSKGD